MSNHKKCEKCKQIKLVEDFLPNFRSFDTYSDWCIQCMHNIYNGDWFSTYKGRQWLKNNSNYQGV